MNSVRTDPSRPFKRNPLPPHAMLDRLTRTEDTFVLCHLGVPRIDAGQWCLSVEGMVDMPRTLYFNNLTSYPKAEVRSVHQCCGSPLRPLEPTRRVCNVVWGGARLADMLADGGIQGDAQYVWSYGADSGEFEGVAGAADAYAKDFPIGRLGADVLIAYEINGMPLPAENGCPARLVVPGFYGTNSVKWLTRIVLAGQRADGPFTTRWYNDPMPDEAGRETGERGWKWALSGRFGAGAGETAGFVVCSCTPMKRICGIRPQWNRRAASRAEGANGVQQPLSGRRNQIHRVLTGPCHLTWRAFAGCAEKVRYMGGR